MMDERVAVIPAGRDILLSRGEYSDYSWICLARVLKDIDPATVYDEWVALHPDQKKTYQLDYNQWTSWLLGESGYLEELSIPSEWNIGDYGRKSEMWVHLRPEED